MDWKKIIGAFGGTMTMVFALLPISFLFVGAGAGAGSQPIAPPCGEEKAAEYGLACMEIDAPWDLVLLTDAYMAVQEKRKDIEDVNPINTALEFLILEETVSRLEQTGTETNEDGEEEPVYEWVEGETEEFIGRDAILEYAGLDENDIDDMTASEIFTTISEVAGSKSTETILYSICLRRNEDLEFVLKEFIGMTDKNIKKVLELYDSQYLVYLYGGMSGVYYGDLDLPDIIVGNVTRIQLAQVACSLLGRGISYGWGSAADRKGPPGSSLDCSGFVNWVYYQCFEQTISGGRIPGGMPNQYRTTAQFYSCQPISESELKIGDLGFYEYPQNVIAGAGQTNHVGIYIGMIDGKRAFIHCSSGYNGIGVSLNPSGSGSNSKTPFGGTFSPPAYPSNFKVFARPQFQFAGDRTSSSDRDNQESDGSSAD